LRLNHGVVELELGQLRPHKFDLRQITYAHALRTDLHDPAERVLIALRQGQRLLRQQHFDESVLHVERERACGVEQLPSRDGLLLLGGFDAMAPLLPPLPDEIGANPVFGRA
jgi:hypothetical protein